MRPESGVNNCLKATRTRLGMSQQQLAEAAGVARQTIGGIEAGLYAPSAAVALRLAKALGCRVEELFWLEEDRPCIEAAPVMQPCASLPLQATLRVALAQVGGKWVAHPLHGEQGFRMEMIPADGIATWEGRGAPLSVQCLDELENLARTVVIAGCAPALSLWARSAERWHPGLRVHWTHANSMEALHRLARGEVHAAGVHLFDPITGAHNVPFVRRVMSECPAVLVNLGLWEEGVLVKPGNPKRLYHIHDLARAEVTIVNRELGAGSRLLLDTLLQEAGVPPTAVQGYDHEVHSHQEVARAIQTGKADAGVSTASVAHVYGLDFVPLRQVRYDLVLREEYLQQEPVRQLLSTLHHRWVRTQLQVLGGYDTTMAGETTVVIPES
jgi:molybdate-binding protein/DNA-binding XRE family transcriptional regulator